MLAPAECGGQSQAHLILVNTIDRGGFENLVISLLFCDYDYDYLSSSLP